MFIFGSSDVEKLHAVVAPSTFLQLQLQLQVPLHYNSSYDYNYSYNYNCAKID